MFRCPYMSTVVLTDSCPSSRETFAIGSPAEEERDDLRLMINYFNSGENLEFSTESGVELDMDVEKVSEAIASDDRDIYKQELKEAFKQLPREEKKEIIKEGIENEVLKELLD